MKASPFLISSSLTVAASLVACGQATRDSGSQLAAASATEPQSTTLRGSDAEGDACSVTITLGADGAVAGLRLDGKFQVDYKLPTPGSGLYGKYRWAGSFDSHVQIADNFSVSRWFGAEYLQGKGKPLFWDTPTVDHKVTATPSLARPTEVSYHSSQNLAVLIPFVTTDLSCKNLIAAP